MDIAFMKKCNWLELGGMDPLDIIKMGTFNAAKMLHVQDELGSVEPGKIADLIILDKNPLDSIKNTLSIYRVISEGKMQTRKFVKNMDRFPLPWLFMPYPRHSFIPQCRYWITQRHAQYLIDDSKGRKHERCPKRQKEYFGVEGSMVGKISQPVIQQHGNHGGNDQIGQQCQYYEAFEDDP